MNAVVVKRYDIEHFMTCMCSCTTSWD